MVWHWPPKHRKFEGASIKMRPVSAADLSVGSLVFTRLDTHGTPKKSPTSQYHCVVGRARGLSSVFTLSVTFFRANCAEAHGVILRLISYGRLRKFFCAKSSWRDICLKVSTEVCVLQC
jgi:hypothetical protein